jgi:hypothetical protein
MPTNSEVLDLPSVRLLFVRMIWKPCLRALLYLYHTERKTPDCSPGDTSESLFCGIFVLYRRAYGNSRLWSGGDNQAANERVRRSQQVPVCLVRGVRPRNPPTSVVGRVNSWKMGRRALLRPT